MLLKNFDKKYTDILSNLISEQQLPGESRRDYLERQAYKDADREAIRREQEPEEYAAKERKEQAIDEFYAREHKQLKDERAAIKECPKMSTKDLQNFILAFTGEGNDGVIKSIAMKEYLKRDDADINFLEDILFDTEKSKDNGLTMGILKKDILIADPKKRIRTKVEAHEYPVEKLKGVVDFLVKNNHYKLFDSNSGPFVSWCDILVGAMRNGNYFTGKWPNESWADK